MSNREQFKECDACAAKPGSPILCPSCLERREAFFKERDAQTDEEIGELRAFYAPQLYSYFGRAARSIERADLFAFLKLQESGRRRYMLELGVEPKKIAPTDQFGLPPEDFAEGRERTPAQLWRDGLIGSAVVDGNVGQPSDVWTPDPNANPIDDLRKAGRVAWGVPPEYETDPLLLRDLRKLQETGRVTVLEGQPMQRPPLKGAGVGMKSKADAARELAEQLRGLADRVEADDVAKLDLDYRLKDGTRGGYRTLTKGVDPGPIFVDGRVEQTMPESERRREERARCVTALQKLAYAFSQPGGQAHETVKMLSPTQAWDAAIDHCVQAIRNLGPA